MLCISLWQPWASLWVCSPREKIHETRDWAVPAKACGRPVLGATIAVHAAKRLVKGNDLNPVCANICEDAFGCHWERTLPRGAVVGTGRLVACWKTEARRGGVDDSELALGDWSDGRYAWQLADVAPLVRAVPWRGLQGWFEFPEERLAIPPEPTGQGVLL